MIEGLANEWDKAERDRTVPSYFILSLFFASIAQAKVLHLGATRAAHAKHARARDLVIGRADGRCPMRVPLRGGVSTKSCERDV